MAQLRILGKDLAPILRETRKKHIASLDEAEAIKKSREAANIATVIESENNKWWRKLLGKPLDENGARAMLAPSYRDWYSCIEASIAYSSIDTYKKCIRNLTSLIYWAEENENNYILITADEMLGL